MSICSPCTKTIPIAYCSDAVYVADWIAGVGIAVQVYWKNTATGRMHHEALTTAADGKVSITFDGIMEGSSYELWINSSTAVTNAKEAFYMPETTDSVTCITVNFNRVQDVTVAESKIEAA